MNSVQGRFGDAAEQARGQRTDRGLAHLAVPLLPRQIEHAGGGAEAGEVPRSHRTLDVVVAQGLDVEQHDRVDRPVQTQRHHERVGQRDQDGEDERREVVDALEHVGQAGTGVDADRSDQERGQRDHDEHRQERHEDQVDVLRDDPLEELVQRTQHGGHQQWRKYLRAVVEDGQRQPEDVHDVDLRAERHRLLAHLFERSESRQHDHGHDREAHPRVSVEFLRGVVGDHQRQEDEDALPAQVDELPRRRKVGARVGPVGNDFERAHQGHEGDEQRGAEQRAEDRTEGVGEEFEEGVQPGELAARTLRASGGLDRGGVDRSGAGHLRQRHDVVVDALHRAADDHLIAVARLRYGAHHTGHRLDIGLLDSGGVAKLEPQPGGAMREPRDVGRSPDAPDDLRCRLRHVSDPSALDPCGRVMLSAESGLRLGFRGCRRRCRAAPRVARRNARRSER